MVMKANNLDNFEEQIKNVLDGHQVAFNPNHWSNLKHQLPQNSTPFYKSKWSLGIGAMILIGIGGAYWLQNQPNIWDELDPQISFENPKLIEDNSGLRLYRESNQTAIHSTKIKSTISENDPISKIYLAIPQKENNNIVNTNDIVSETNNNTSTSLTGSDKAPDEPLVFEPDQISKPSDIAAPKTEVLKPNAQFTLVSNEFCDGSTIDFTSTNQPNVEYTWYFGDGAYSQESNPSHRYKNTGEFTVQLIVRSTLDNKIVAKSKEEIITIHPQPNVVFEHQTIRENGILVNMFADLSENTISSLWDFGNNHTSSNKTAIHHFKKKGQYTVLLTAENEFGCAQTLSKTIVVNEDFNLLAPNSFTPNGDGINDYFIPEALKTMNTKFTMKVISQTEGLVFETKSSNVMWNGINQQDGTVCKEGNYLWIVTLTNEYGETEQYKGAVLLLK